MSASAVTALGTLLATLSPRLIEGEWVYVSLPRDLPPADLAPLGFFCEDEGVTAICRVETARLHAFPFTVTFRQITLDVHSSLEAVGLIAAVSAALARERIPCNVVSAFFHDHLFVPAADAMRALETLRRLSHTPAPN